MRYVPYDDLDGAPNIIVDGPPTGGTVLTLSHWRGSGSPEQLAADLSTQIAFNYLDRPEMHVDAEAVSNNHFDEDGLCGVYAVLHPDEARQHRDLLIDIASAGDFGTFRARDAARICFALFAYGDPARSPLALPEPYEEQCAVLYATLLGLLPDLLAHPERFDELWAEEDATFERDAARLASGAISISEAPDVDLAIVASSDGFPHEFVVNNATQRLRVLEIAGDRYRLRYRYETWVLFVSRPTMPRVPLEDLADDLSARDEVPWSFPGIDRITPALQPDGPSVLPPDEVRAAVEEFLRARGADAA